MQEIKAERGCASGHTYIFQSFGRTYLINAIEIWKKIIIQPIRLFV